jgi:cytochrome c oxidase accessory protein FixG
VTTAPSIAESRHGNLSTLNNDGSRRWLKPRPSRGRFWRRRRAVGILLIAIFTLIPYLKMNVLPLVLLDIVHRRFTLFGTTFLPTDTVIMALFVIGVFLLIFLLTALLGRVWCGWACPQTVYMEFVFRPIERWLEGEPGRTAKRVPGGTFIKYVLYVLVSMFLAHTFLAYFVGVQALLEWVTRSPLEHPTSFIIMATVTGLMLLDFGFFREQICIVMCPYGRFQSVLLDRSSMIVGYDSKRGEPRGKKKSVALPVLATAGATSGDCIDCRMCVTTCPTGIDIREGLQMECLHCAQCIDACDAVMDKISRPRGLIRYSSQSGLDGEPKKRFRPRLVLYPALLTVIFGLLVTVIATRASADVTLLRGKGMPFTELPSGEVSNTVRLKITNRTQQPAQYSVSLVQPPAGARVDAEEFPLTVAGGEQRTAGVTVILPRATYVPSGVVEVRIQVTDGAGFKSEETYRLLGPMNMRTAQPRDGQVDSRGGNAGRANASEEHGHE